MIAVEERAAAKTKAARLAMERRRYNQQVTPPRTADDTHIISDKPTIEINDEVDEAELNREVLPYDEIEIYD